MLSGSPDLHIRKIYDVVTERSKLIMAHSGIPKTKDEKRLQKVMETYKRRYCDAAVVLRNDFRELLDIYYCIVGTEKAKICNFEYIPQKVYLKIQSLEVQIEELRYQMRLKRKEISKYN